LKIHLSLIRCRYCEHANPADAKFCSACGGELHLPSHLTSCLRCGTVNPAKATTCIWCRSSLPESKAGALVPSSLAAKVSRFLPRRTSGVIAGAVVLAAIGALGYYGYRQASPVDAPQPEATSSEAGDRGAPAGAGIIGGDAAADAKSARADDTSPASGNPLVPTARAATNQPRAGRQPAESQEGQAAAAAITRSQTINVGRQGEPGPSHPEACTEALAALGLCATKPEAGKASGQGPPRAPACTAAEEALGLCAPRTTQRRE